MSEKTADLDETITELNNMLKGADLKTGDKLKIVDRLLKAYNLRLKYAGSSRGGSFNRPAGSQT